MANENKSFWNDNFLGYVLKNVIIASIIIAVLAFGTFLMLGLYTNHGKSEKVPNLKGLTSEEAEMILKNHNLKMEVIDSVYSKITKPGAILEQNPVPESIVKPGRIVYITLNSKSKRKVAMPQVIEVSLRQAEAMLTSVGLQLDQIKYIPSDYKDLVLGVQIDGKSVNSGTQLLEGAKITLLVGNGTGAIASAIPSLKGVDLNTAISMINSSSYTVGGIIYDEQPSGDNATYYVYKQRPMAGDSVSIGDHIDIWLSKNKNKKDDSVISNTDNSTKKNNNQSTTKEKAKDIEDFF